LVAVILGFDEFELDEARLELRRAGQVVKADALVLKLLAVLARNSGRLVTKDELVDAVWEGRAVADNVLTVSMARLRKTLGHRRGEREFVATVYGRGYRFVCEAREAIVNADTKPARSRPPPPPSPGP
jgi:DNA-binding winged helix-turn-helix (wHTH) protein